MYVINRKELNNDGIGFVEQYDFSRANLNEESRVNAVTYVASVCYGNPKAIGSVSLYNHLATENKGLPSSSYEFVPVLIDIGTHDWRKYSSLSSCSKYGEMVEGSSYLLTNLRALLADVGDHASEFFNTEEECKIIAKHFKVFKSKIDFNTRSQYIRHRVSWQELSRRYVSGKRAKLEFYVSDKLGDVHRGGLGRGYYDDVGCLIDLAVKFYDQAIAQGVKPEEARRVLPQAMYTTVWSAWQPKQLDVFFKLRLDSHAQQEIRWLAEAKKAMLNA